MNQLADYPPLPLYRNSYNNLPKGGSSYFHPPVPASPVLSGRRSGRCGDSKYMYGGGEFTAAAKSIAWIRWMSYCKDVFIQNSFPIPPHLNLRLPAVDAQVDAVIQNIRVASVNSPTLLRIPHGYDE